MRSFSIITTITTLATRQEKSNVNVREIPSRHESVYKLGLFPRNKMDTGGGSHRAATADDLLRSEEITSVFTAEFSQSGWCVK
jgi:hypothetical protein